MNRDAASRDFIFSCLSSVVVHEARGHSLQKLAAGTKNPPEAVGGRVRARRPRAPRARLETGRLSARAPRRSQSQCHCRLPQPIRIRSSAASRLSLRVDSAFRPWCVSRRSPPRRCRRSSRGKPCLSESPRPLFTQGRSPAGRLSRSWMPSRLARMLRQLSKQGRTRGHGPEAKGGSARGARQSTGRPDRGPGEAKPHRGHTL